MNHDRFRHFPMSMFVNQAYNDGGVETDVMLDRIHAEIGKYAGCLGNLLCYAWVNIPLVYTQIVTISVHLYFAVALLGMFYP